MKTMIEELEHAARSFCMRKRQYTYARRGRTDVPTYASWSTPVEIVPDSDQEPCVIGYGYWKTSFNNGHGFATMLYTHSTFRIEVGEDWIPSEIDLW